ncbi:hypothetical protein ACVWYG_003970 [Pedobacter sp. UYEF25]
MLKLIFLSSYVAYLKGPYYFIHLLSRLEKLFDAIQLSRQSFTN